MKPSASRVQFQLFPGYALLCPSEKFQHLLRLAPQHMDIVGHLRYTFIKRLLLFLTATSIINRLRLLSVVLDLRP